MRSCSSRRTVTALPAPRPLRNHSPDGVNAQRPPALSWTTRASCSARSHRSSPTPRPQPVALPREVDLPTVVEHDRRGVVGDLEPDVEDRGPPEPEHPGAAVE